MNPGARGQKTRVLHLIPTLNIGGAELDMVRKSLVLAESGDFEFHILPYQGIGPLSELLHSSQGIEVLSPYRKETAGMFAAAFKLRRLLERVKPHVLHLHMFRSEIVSLPVSLGGKRPTVVYTIQHMADDVPFWQRITTRLTSFSKDTIVASSEAVKQSLVDSVKIPDNKIEVIYNGVDFSKFDGLSHSPPSLERPIIGTITRLHPDKGNQYLIEAMPRVIQEFPDAYCWIIGGGEEAPTLEALARRLGLQDRIKFWGLVEEPFHLLAQMSLFVFPSVTEALGIALVEAAGLGVPSVASGIGGIPEVLDTKSDWLVPPRHPNALADKILEVLKRYPEAQKEAITLSHRIRNKFDVDRLAAEQAELYRRVVADKSQ